MSIKKTTKWSGLKATTLPIACAVGILYAINGFGQLTPPENYIPPGNELGAWSFNASNWWSDWGICPVEFTNIASVPGGAGMALLVDCPDAPAYLKYNVFEADGTTNLTVDCGTVIFWIAPNWASASQGGDGLGKAGRLIEVGQFGANGYSGGWWSLYVDSAGDHLVFAGQAPNGAEVDYLTAPIAWNTSTNTNTWYLVTLTYTPTNSELFIDNASVATGQGVSFVPSQDVLANGFFVGSDVTGTLQCRAALSRLSTYDYPVESGTISGEWALYSIFYGGESRYAQAHVAQALSSPSSTPGGTNAITGTGVLGLVGAVPAISSSSVWITNVSVKTGNNGTTITFTIQGGEDDTPYDVFANSVLSFGTNGIPWSWQGAGYHGNTYTITNLPDTTCFLILGLPTDSDGDYLTDAYELLVSKTNPNVADSNLDGLLDSWEVLLGIKNSINDPNARSGYSYDDGDWLYGVSGVRTGSITLDDEGNVKSVSQ